MIRSVLFDAFGTLCEILKKHNPYKPILKAWPSGLAAAYQAIMTRDASPAEFAKEAELSAQIIQKVDADIADEIASIRLFPEVVETLSKIKELGLKWGIISNLAAPYAQPLLDLLFIAPDACIWSFAVDYRKPEKETYDCTCTALGLTPSDILIVDDLVLPKNSGCRQKFCDAVQGR